VVVNFNTREHLRACLASVIAEAGSEVVVVDNASSDGSAEMVRACFPDVVIHANASNIGYGAAANQAIATCRAEYVLLLNADTCLRPGALAALADYLDQHPKAAVVGPRLVEANGRLQASCYPFPTPLNTLLDISCASYLLRYLPSGWSGSRARSHEQARAVPWVKGAALAIRRNAFDSVNGFDESFFMYTEEVDLCYRFHLLGWEVHFSPAASVVHVGGASTMQRKPEMAVQLFASIVRYYRRHSTKLQLVPVIIIIKALMMARLLRDILHLCIVKDSAQRIAIVRDMSAWRHILFAPSRDW
jgi:GT2 family glycosyltransferase